MDALLADVIAVGHALYALFVVVGFVLVLVGALRGWEWVRDLRFRLVHLAATVLVAIEAFLGWTCPLTTWEHELRLRAGQSPEDISFMARLARNLLFLDVPEWVFPILHVGFGAIVIAGFVLAPPRLRRRDGS